MGVVAYVLRLYGLGLQGLRLEPRSCIVLLHGSQGALPRIGPLRATSAFPTARGVAWPLQYSNAAMSGAQKPKA
jgi:hypothetical protein